MSPTTTQQVQYFINIAVVVCAMAWGMQIATALERGGVLDWVGAALALAGLALVGHVKRLLRRAEGATGGEPTHAETSAPGPPSE